MSDRTIKKDVPAWMVKALVEENTSVLDRIERDVRHAKPDLWLRLHIWKHLPMNGTFHCADADAWIAWNGMDVRTKPKSATFTRHDCPAMYRVLSEGNDEGTTQIQFAFDAGIRVLRAIGRDDIADEKERQYGKAFIADRAAEDSAGDEMGCDRFDQF